ncbi:6-hydroxy-D-nicotine oxidase [Aspergillus heteromorphus CBS 117.55]|uniref:6-hydroxy-D-nicotine oxidase n=1 Tax=Aspergillus heteromorphus CBS 117.55 TaxID=1448321 RepID=A0A317WT04_9EURO|nr:6-hydroxy-D-nicotine oxidase [Aspergillus heteromorphus CBS 117.55]PWY88422.1 6-hydroxy-D-nicotine oxidase [Aspergillus heteromorphus CBS 117.55]
MAATAFDQLRLLFPENTTEKVVTPIDQDNNSEKYQAAVSRPWSQTCWIPAAAYVYLSSVQELIQALAIVRKTGTKFAIRTTGHNPNAGFSSAGETAVVLDISQLKSKELITADEGVTVAQFGAGNTWGDVYHWLEERGLSAIGGRDSQVGLGGFLLGGGMGALPNLHGLGADGVRNFEVLLADGRLVNANANENSDLYRALKGGGSNFGIVTRLDLATHPLINVQYTINLYNPDDHVAINQATVAVQQAMEEDPKIGLFTNFNNGFVAVGLLYGDHPAEPPQAFGPFHNLKSLVATALQSTNGTLLSLAQAMGHPQTAQKRRICTITTKVSHDLYEEVFKAWGEVSKTLPTGAVLHYTIQPFGKAGVQAGKARGENIMGHENVSQCWWVFTCEWPKDGSDDAAAENAIDAMSEKVQSLANAKGLLLDFKCMSFATASQKVLGSYGAENVKRMREVAAKYDPEGVFQKLQNGGFLLRDNV